MLDILKQSISETFGSRLNESESAEGLQTLLGLSAAVRNGADSHAQGVESPSHRSESESCTDCRLAPMTELVDSLEQSAKELDAAVNEFIKRKG